MTRFVVRRGSDADYRPVGALAPGAIGLTRWRAVGEDDAAHTDFGISRLEPGGSTAAHVHSFEESFNVIEGEVVLATPEATVRLVAGDYGVIPIGVPHAWRAVDDATGAAWSDLFTPPARERYGSDTYRVPEIPEVLPVPVDARDPRTRSFGNITPEHMDPAKQSQELLAVSGSMRTALLVYTGISLKMMVDSDLGATLGTMFMVQYAPDGAAGPHDHPLEEAYLILDGEVRATFDGEEFLLGPGDIAWAGVGCVHSFSATGAEVRWLETQAPQMPPRHAYRFVRDWQYLDGRLEEEV